MCCHLSRNLEYSGSADSKLVAHWPRRGSSKPRTSHRAGSATLKSLAALPGTWSRAKIALFVVNIIVQATMSESNMVSEFTLPGPKPLKIVVTEGDITEEDSDAIVNAANNHMMGGKGVDGAVHSKAGRQLLEECKKLPVVEPPRTRLRTGDATLLPGFNLKARYVIAAVGPIYHSEALSVPLLQKAFRRVLEIARDRDDIKSVSFPALSCGIFRFPASLAASVFFNEILSAHEETSTAGGIGLEEVRIVLFGPEMFNIWLKTAEDVLREKLKPGSSSTKEDL